MKIKLSFLLCSLAASLWVCSAAEPAKAAKVVKLPASTVQSVDWTNFTFTVEHQKTNLTVYVTSKTRFFKDGKPAVSKELAAGEKVRGTLQKAANGHSEALRIYMGTIGNAPAPKKKTTAPKHPAVKP